MDLVLGLSMTSKDIRGVLVDGATGEGGHVDRAVLDIADVDAFDAEAFLEKLLIDGDLHTVGVTWSADAEPAARKVREALAVLGSGAAVVAVPEVEATKVLARGIADITGHDFLVVCIVEPDGTDVAAVYGQHVTVERIAGSGSETLIDRVCAVVRGVRPRPDVIFVLGSEEDEALVSALRTAMDRPVITAADGDLALARGAALASAAATTTPDAPPARPRISKVAALASTLAAAVVVFVVSVSLAVGWQLRPEPAGQPRLTTAEGHTVRPAAPPPPVRKPVVAAPAPAPEVVPPAPAAPPPAPISAAPIAQQPVYQPPPAPVYQPPAPVYQAPAPVYQAPPPPVYVPPPPQPRLRDRILDRMPIIGRFR